MTAPPPGSAATATLAPTAQEAAGPVRDRLIPTLRKGTVTSVGSETVNVQLGVDPSAADDTKSTPMGWVGDRSLVGQVVSVLHVFGSALVIGPTSLDVWHTVGAAGEPAFTAPWANISGTRKAGFRLSGDRVELCGAAGTGVTTVTGTQTIFTLPVGYRPDATLRFTWSLNQNAGNNIAASVFVLTTGAVQVGHFAGTIAIGSVGFEGLSFPLIGAV